MRLYDVSYRIVSMVRRRLTRTENENDDIYDYTCRLLSNEKFLKKLELVLFLDTRKSSVIDVLWILTNIIAIVDRPRWRVLMEDKYNFNSIFS